MPESSKLPLYLRNLNYKLQTALYDSYKTVQADIVMLGDSITFGADWNALLNRSDIANRGIPGDYTEGLLARLEYVYTLHPKVCFIMGGINDLYEDVPVDAIGETYTTIINGLRSHQIVPVIQSTLYAGRGWPRYEQKNVEVAQLNGRLHKFAEENDIVFLDLNRLLAEDNRLGDQFTFDGLHLVGKAYEVWARHIERVLNQYGL